jgi:histidyl-tRNA synthetase
VALDKLDKSGAEGVVNALVADGFSPATIEAVRPLLSLQGNTEEKLNFMQKLLEGNDSGQKGLEEIRFVIKRAAKGLQGTRLEFDVTLARGLNYYTGAIFEVVAKNVQMGSICGGGRYDDLTGIFGLPGVSGIGVSFGADRIYDVMNELNLFPPQTGGAVSLLLAHFGEEERDRCLEMAQELRAEGISTEVYPDVTKIKKQFKYADDKKIRFVGVIGPDELKQGTISLKNLVSGEQQALTVAQVAAAIMR